MNESLKNTRCCFQISWRSALAIPLSRITFKDIKKEGIFILEIEAIETLN
jgi:hypothetical protein